MIAELVQLLLVQQGAVEYPLAHIIEIIEQTQCPIHAEAYALLVDEVQPGLTDQLEDELQYDYVLGGAYGGQEDLIQHIAHIQALLLLVVDAALPMAGRRKAEREIGQANDAADRRQYLNTFIGCFLPNEADELTVMVVGELGDLP